MPGIGTAAGTAFAQGLLSARPAAAVANTGFYYFATDDNGGTLYQSTGAAWVQLGMPVNGYRISNQVVGAGGAATVTLPSSGTIPGTYNWLRLIGACRSDAAVATFSVALTFNADGGANYYHERIQGQAATPTSAELLGQTSMIIAYSYGANVAAGFGGIFICDIPFYADTLMHKMLTSHNPRFLDNATTNQFLVTLGGRWASTAAITAITLTPSSGKFVQNSHFALYGIP